MASAHQISVTNRQLRGITGLLIAQFILGVSLTTFISYNPHKSTAAQTVFLILHIIVAAGLLAGAVLRLFLAIKWHILLTPAITGIIGIVLAMIAGGFASSDGNSVAVFLMSIGFITAFVSYGYSLGVTLPTSARQH